MPSESKRDRKASPKGDGATRTSKADRLPFEPRKNKKQKVAKTAPSVSKNKYQSRQDDASLAAIPDAVSKRMVRRMALFCGIPSALGMSSLVIFYWLKANDIIDLPPYAALIVSLGFLVLGIIGLSFGIFSASWDEERVGSLLGIEELKLNLPRVFTALRSIKKKPQEE